MRPIHPRAAAAGQLGASIGVRSRNHREAQSVTATPMTRRERRAAERAARDAAARAGATGGSTGSDGAVGSPPTSRPVPASAETPPSPSRTPASRRPTAHSGRHPGRAHPATSWESGGDGQASMDWAQIVSGSQSSTPPRGSAARPGPGGKGSGRTGSGRRSGSGRRGSVKSASAGPGPATPSTSAHRTAVTPVRRGGRTDHPTHRPAAPAAQTPPSSPTPASHSSSRSTREVPTRRLPPAGRGLAARGHFPG